jgi:hypothetical protein
LQTHWQFDVFAIAEPSCLFDRTIIGVLVRGLLTALEARVHLQSIQQPDVLVQDSAKPRSVANARGDTMICASP